MLLFLCLFLIQQSVDCQLTVQYYQDLLNQNSAASQQYQTPTNNVQWQQGIESSTINDFGEYDFIIMGGGTAGSVMATRLSEVDHFHVLLLEAGNEETDFSQVPGWYSYNLASPMNWGYYSTPQNNVCAGSPGRRCQLSRGKVLGGTSSINAIIYNRGTPADYDGIAKMGNPNWSYKKVLPYFMKSENAQIRGDQGCHGKGGLWNVEYPKPFSPYLENFYNASAQFGSPLRDDTSRHAFSSSPIYYSKKMGRRQSTNAAFLTMARERLNLNVLTNALVTQILINNSTRRAEGVEFVTSNRKFRANARREIIISAGAANSPQVLQLSGIGPRRQLENLGIEVIADLPVGQNYADQLSFVIPFQTNITTEAVPLQNQIQDYLQGAGPLTNVLGMEGVAFFPTTNQPNGRSIQLFFIPPNAGTSTFAIVVVLLHPSSRGEVTLQSNNPLDFPNLNANFLNENVDREILRDGINLVMGMVATEPFQRIGASFIQFAPSCSNFELFSTDYWDCTIRQAGGSAQHMSSSNSMGPDSRTSVVDQNLKVHGLHNLRVVDTSVFPTTLSGNPSAPTVMLAEKISDVIKHDYGFSTSQ